jgi:hypothetical protein
MDFDYDAGVEVAFAEDLTYADVAPVLDAFSKTRVFTVRASRVGWSGPAAGGPEIGVILTAIAGVGGAAFVGAFCAELAKDTYKGVRSAILGVVRRLRDQDPEKRRAVVGLSIHVQQVKICIGPILESEPTSDQWTDEWFVERLLRAQAIINDRGGTPRVPDPELIGPEGDCEDWLE